MIFFSGNNAIPPSKTLNLPESWGESKTDFSWEDDRITALFTNTRTLSSKAALTIALFAAVNRNYDQKQRTLKHRETQNGSKSTNHKYQTVTFWTRWSEFLFFNRSAKMIDGSEKRKRQFTFELQNSRVFEKRSKIEQKEGVGRKKYACP